MATYLRRRIYRSREMSAPLKKISESLRPISLEIGWNVTFSSVLPLLDHYYSNWMDTHPIIIMADVVCIGVSKGVILFCMPPNTTHATQPLDKTCFHSFQQHRDRVVNEYMTANPGRLVTVYTFNQLFHTA